MAGSVSMIIILIEVFFGIVIGLYFLSLLKNQKVSKAALDKGSEKEMKKLKIMRSISLTEPLSEKTRPAELSDIVGQEEGIRALRAALCSSNPQHIIIYGPPGIGKTAAARVVLEEAKRNKLSPFTSISKFIEIDATTIRFDERGIADPLIGSVHDPIYQGAGAYGPAGVPQPKQGAVSKAHGGVLFIDEIGELHPIEMNKLLKVLEDRKVFLESAYYNEEDKNIPKHIHDIFQNGLPADFRLIGATTRNPSDIPPALRSRCVEIFFRPLSREETALISKNAAAKGKFILEEGCENLIAMYASNGRDAVNIIQIAGSIAMMEERDTIRRKDIEWVIEFQKYDPIVEKKASEVCKIGIVNGLGVSSYNYGSILEIEVQAFKVEAGKGRVSISGIAEQEQINSGSRNLTFTGSARSSVENVMTAISGLYGIDFSKYDIHVYFSGGYADGPSAGVTLAVSMYSAIYKIPVPNNIAMTGEVSVYGNVKPVGGVWSKIEGAIRLGINTVIIPEENYHENFGTLGINVIRAKSLQDVIKYIFKQANEVANNNIEAEGA